MKPEPYLSKLSYYLILFFAFSFAVFPKALPAIIVLLSLSLIAKFILGPKIIFYPDLPLILMIGLYLLYLAGILWTTDINEGKASLETMLSIVLFPILFMISREFFKTNLLQILIFFILGCLISVFIHLTVAFWESTSFVNGSLFFNTIDPNCATWEYGGSHFRYTNLSPDIHPTYYSAYLILASIGSIFMIRSKNLSNRYLINILRLSVPVFMIMIYLLSSKAGIVGAALLLFFYAITWIRESENLIRKFIIALSCFSLIFLGFQNSRFDSLKQAIRNPEIVCDNNASGSIISRIHIWKASLEVISANIFLGVGTGDLTSELDKRYEIYQYKELHRVKSHAHNQFLEIFLNLGIVGFLLLITVFLYPINQSVRQKNTVFLLFLLLIFFNFLFESMLNTMAGTIFFSFFYCLLSITDLNEMKPVMSKNI